MPRQKDLKATRKLKRKQSKVNNRRRNIGKKPLSFKHFYKTSHKRNRNEFESKHKKDDVQTPNKKRKLNRDTKPRAPRAGPFGFGAPMNDTEPEYQRFLADIDESDSEDESSTDTEQNDTIQNALEPPNESQLTAQNSQIKNQIKEHQSALESLKSADPDFYQHLQEMEGNLLSFGDRDEFNLGDLGDIDSVVDTIQTQQMKQNMNEMENDETSNNKHVQDDIDSFMNDDEEDEEDEEDIEDDDVGTMFPFDISELKNLITDMEQNRSVDALKTVLNGFCCFIELTMDDEKKGNKMSKQSIVVANDPAFQHLLHYALSALGATMVSVLDISSKEELQVGRLKDNRRYKKCRSSITRYFKFLFVFFKNVDDDAMQKLFVVHCRELVFLLLNMTQSVKRLYFKHVTKLWASTTPAVRIDAFIFLYEAGKRMHNEDNQLLVLFKYMYGSYVRICKRVSPVTMPGIQFMMNCMVEMYALNPVLSYKDAFRRLRSIAFHVKQSIQIMAKHESNHAVARHNEIRSVKLKKHKLECVQSVYNWRFINIVMLWSKILASHANRNNSDLHLLYYPFVQICCSVLTLSRSAAYDPARLKVIQALCHLIREAQKSPVMQRRIYVPLAPYLISIINNPAFTKKTKAKKQNTNDKKSDFDIRYRVKIGAAHFNTYYLHHALITSAVKWMSSYFSCYSHSIAFPEIVFPTQVFLREFLSNSSITNAIKSGVKLLSVKLKENANWIVNKRKTVQFSPKDFDKVNAFLASERMRGVSPLAKFVSSKQFETTFVVHKERYEKENEETERNEANKNEGKKKKKKKKKS
eukprot:25370_1